MERPSTPPRSTRSTRANPISPPTPDIKRRIEENRLKAKAIRDQHEAARRQEGAVPAFSRTPSGFAADVETSMTSRKRTHASISTANIPATSRDARNIKDGDASYSIPRADSNIQAAKKFTKYVDYDFSRMADTKGGFMTIEDDPHNKALHKPEDAAKPAHMSLKEWERLQLERDLRRRKVGKYEPGLSVLDRDQNKKCRECGNLEVDYQWEEVFHCLVCNGCKEKFPDKYSLLTKTEAKDDYLLTDPELKDPDLLPHLNKPNPHKSHWHDMMLFLRYQVEEYAFSTKWGSAEALDAEFEKRETDKKKRKEDKFKSKLLELKKKTRTEAYRKSLKAGASGGAFGDAINGGKHEHEWGQEVEKPDGMTVRTCVECGMEVEELTF